MGVRTQLNRVRSLERASGPHWLLKYIGSIEQFEAEVKVGVAAKALDPIDGPFLVVVFKRWLKDLA